jgi:hypothetical protein
MTALSDGECYLVDEPGTWTDPRTGEVKEYDVKEVGLTSSMSTHLLNRG